MNDRRVDIDNSGIVGESSVSPFATNEADAAIAETVVHATIKSDLSTPIASVKEVDAARAPTPIPGRP
jgi:hypothetical protein